MHPNLGLISYSSLCLLHTCPRKFQLYKLINPEIAAKERDVHTDFGHLVGYGVQVLLISGSRELAYLKMLAAWRQDLDDDEGMRDKKTFFHALAAIDNFVNVRETILRDFEVVIFDQKAAAELGFIIEFFGDFKYRGFLDILLIHKVTGQFAVVECKTTKYSKINFAQYARSAQGLGYSVVVDAISSALKMPQADSFRVYYMVWSTGAHEWVEMPVDYSHSERATWMKNVLLDVKRIAEFAAEEHFPQHGESCFSFFRECEYFQVCGMSDKALLLERSKIVEDEDRYQFRFSLEEMLDAQLEKHELASGNRE